MSSVSMNADYDESGSDELAPAPTRGRPKSRVTKAKAPAKAKPAARAAKATKTAKVAKPAKAKAKATTKTTRGAKAVKTVRAAAKPVKAKVAAKPARGAKAAKTTKAVKAAKPVRATKTVKAAAKGRVGRPPSAKPKVVKEPKVDGRRRPTKKVLKVLPVPDKSVIIAIQEISPAGQAIRDFRVGINVNMRAFAELLGVNPATVFRWETERTERIQSSSQQKLRSLVNKVIMRKPVKIAG
jgi:DNA-binding transcriptional regulator YiaG